MPSRQGASGEALKYRRGATVHLTTNDSRWGGKLEQWDLEDPERERRLDDKDNAMADLYPDQQAAGYEAWRAHLFRPGVDAATRKIIAMDHAAAYWSHCSQPFGGSDADCHWLANHGCAIGPWNSPHYKGQRKLPRKQQKAAGGRAGNAVVKGPADDAHRQGKRIGVGGKPPKETPKATYCASRAFEAASVQLKGGAAQLATQQQRYADPDAFLEPHKRVEGVRGEVTCCVYQTDVLDCGGRTTREHDHKTGNESVSPVGHTPNSGVVEAVRTHKNHGAERGAYMNLLGEGMRLLLGRDAGVSPRARALVAEAREAALRCSWEKRDAQLNAPSALEAKKAAREAREAAAARGELDDDGADADDEAPPVPRNGPPPLPDSEGEAEWEDEVEDDGHAEDADALKAALATYLSKWGGDPRADDVRASLVAAFEA